MPLLKCHPLRFYSILDEDLFFAGLKKISAVKKIAGNSEGLFITVTAKPSQTALRALVGLFFRFGIEMPQLAQFLTKENSRWFNSPDAYWFKKVFPKD